MRLICVNSGLNISNRKIVPHTGRKTIVQTLESLGETTLNIRKQSRHRSDEMSISVNRRKRTVAYDGTFS